MRYYGGGVGHLDPRKFEPAVDLVEVGDEGTRPDHSYDNMDGSDDSDDEDDDDDCDDGDDGGQSDTEESSDEEATNVY